MAEPGSGPTAKSARRVADALRERGVDAEVVELPDSARTAADAAAALGCSPAEIVKSLVFRTASSTPLLVLAPGDRQVDLTAVERQVGEPVERAPAAWVREQTGFAVGGIPPLGHTTPLHTLVDPALVALPRVWAAAGTPHAVFALAGSRLPEATGGRTVPVTTAAP